MPEILLDARHLSMEFGGGFWRQGAVVKAVSDVSIQVRRGEVLGIVGESGSGKSTLGRLLLGLSKPTRGEVVFDGEPIAAMGSRESRLLRKRMQLVFQDPYSSLDPLRRVADQIADPLRIHGSPEGRPFHEVVNDLLLAVGLEPDHASRFPNQFSGGQRQRIAIARALATGPDLLIADEAVSALDVTVQAQILRLLADLRAKLNMSMVFISHDLAVVRYICDRVAVMYLGRVIEEGETEALFSSPRHPYTRALLASVPQIAARAAPATPLRGEIPSPLDPPSGCGFRTRCPHARPQCAETIPHLREAGPDHRAACVRLEDMIHEPLPSAANKH